MNKKKKLFIAVIFCLAASLTVPAQANINGALKGRVNDASDASVQGAAVNSFSSVISAHDGREES